MGVTITWGAILKGPSVRKFENLCPRRRTFLAFFMKGWAHFQDWVKHLLHWGPTFCLRGPPLDWETVLLCSGSYRKRTLPVCGWVPLPLDALATILHIPYSALSTPSVDPFSEFHTAATVDPKITPQTVVTTCLLLHNELLSFSCCCFWWWRWWWCVLCVVRREACQIHWLDHKEQKWHQVNEQFLCCSEGADDGRPFRIAPCSRFFYAFSLCPIPSSFYLFCWLCLGNLENLVAEMKTLPPCFRVRTQELPWNARLRKAGPCLPQTGSRAR